MVLHLSERSLRCHHCGRVEGIRAPVPNAAIRICSRSAGEHSGSSSRSRKNFPRADTAPGHGRVRGGSGLEALSSAAQADILVGPDPRQGRSLRAASRWLGVNADAACFQISRRASGPAHWQVAGDVRRASLPGEVFVQTRYPDLYHRWSGTLHGASRPSLRAPRRCPGAVIRAWGIFLDES